MPTNATIAMSVRPPQVQDPIQMMQGVATLRAMGQESQLRDRHMQQYDLENKQRQRAMEGQQKMADLMSQHTTQVDGGFVTDHGAVEDGLAKAGFGAEALKYGIDRRANEKAQLENHKTQMENLKHQVDMVGQLAGPVVSTYDRDIANPDAAKRTPPDQLNAMYQDAHTRALRMGLMKPGDEPDTILSPDGTVNSEAMNRVRSHYQSAMSAYDQANKQQHDMDYALNINKFQQELLREAPKTEQAWLQHASQLLGTADTEQHWDAAIANLRQAKAPASVINQFGAVWTPEGQKRASELGMTPEQREMNAERKERQSQLDQYRQDMLGLRDESLQFRKTMASIIHNQTANSKAVDNRQSRTEFDKAAREEDDLHTTRLQLGSAIGRAQSAIQAGGGKLNATDGLTYIDKHGNAKPMSTASAESGQTAEALLDDMTARYKGLTGTLKRVMGDKYDAMGRLGGQPQVSLQDAIGKIDEGDAKLFPGTAKKTDPPPAKADTGAALPPAGSPPPKATTVQQVSESELRKRAKAAGKDENAAVAAAKAKGFKLIP